MKLVCGECWLARRSRSNWLYICDVKASDQASFLSKLFITQTDTSIYIYIHFFINASYFLLFFFLIFKLSYSNNYVLIYTLLDICFLVIDLWSFFFQAFSGFIWFVIIRNSWYLNPKYFEQISINCLEINWTWNSVFLLNSGSPGWFFYNIFWFHDFHLVYHQFINL